jgi:hypothetical protein
MALSPIVLFVYNRSWHTKQTLEALAKNNLADQSDLLVFADGPKPNASDDDLMKIQEVRTIVSGRKWCKTVTIIESKTNKGLADSIIEGVTSVVNSYGKVIVLEDDIVTSPGFLTYMNEALTVYEKDEKVMHISGYIYPVRKKLPSLFFYNQTSCWGWATWDRAWKYFNPDAKMLEKLIISQNLKSKLTIDNSTDFYSHLQKNISGEMNTWAIKWHASTILNHGFCLHPYPSLTNNIGHDSSGINSTLTKKYSWGELSPKITVKRIKIRESKKARKAVSHFYLIKQTFLTGIIMLCKHKLKLLLIKMKIV